MYHLVFSCFLLSIAALSWCFGSLPLHNYLSPGFYAQKLACGVEAWETFTSDAKNYENSSSFVTHFFLTIPLAAISKCEWSLCFINRKMCLMQRYCVVQASVLCCESVLYVFFLILECM